MHYVIGIDGGGSRTRAWLADVEGHVVARGAVGGANAHQLGPAAAAAVMADAACAAIAEVGLAMEPAIRSSVIFAGVAGAGAVDDQRQLAGELSRRLEIPPALCAVDHDLRIALAGALAGEPGVVIVAGTGAAAYGRSSDGRSAKAGGWGPALDDGGSGHWLGVQAMRAIVRAADGRESPPGFGDGVLAAIGVSGPREMLNRLRDAPPVGLDRAAIARLAPLVIAAAARGDAIAQAVVHRGAAELALMVKAVILRLDPSASGVRLSCAGGLLEHEPYYRERVIDALAQCGAGTRFELPLLPPVAGAILLGLALADVEISPAVVGRLQKSAAMGSLEV